MTRSIAKHSGGHVSRKGISQRIQESLALKSQVPPNPYLLSESAAGSPAEISRFRVEGAPEYVRFRVLGAPEYGGLDF